ncbi:uncharacterized protein LOC110464708 [Mizuhopecten yessoensis]|uniref:Tripartite motif-containing protein 2 n=1 Tax=Mizuhopecten yessoensis TaxID=6573 RepID=A0A210PT91_MIZYE|nr:uncharacterized protein LOC110464708 [Mizuhopecten yessoensis]XP_021375737.1 uncharacterized protein LOC110464708 [Mizuhopecten yessoensis]XP_021375738.1 uncharacterized protein LOC110464708 [Mizuhopecten yessoensis]XP_021375739.1 uncharacterized protein LOC110464708 [Mizuhopecten yessoensis]OWF39705.1 Tripartite motif-containing protein 2 [Mizuhopecten yessoensis]
MYLDNILSTLERSLSESASQREHLQDITDECVSDIHRRTGFLHAAIDEIDKTLTKRVLDLQDTELHRLAKHEQQIQKTLVEFSSRKAASNKRCTELTCHDPVNTSYHEEELLDEELIQVQKLTDLERVCLTFKSASVSQDDLSPMFGSIEYFHITLPSPISTESHAPVQSPRFLIKRFANFNCNESSPNIHALLPISATEAWICCGWGSKDIHLYDIDGSTKASLTLDVAVDHMVMTSCGDLLVSTYNGTVITRIDEHLQMTKFATLNFIPRGMTVSDSREIYICGVERIPGKSESNRYLIVKMSEEGHVISDIDVAPHDPHRIAVDSNGNMFFSDNNNSRREFVVMDSTGNVKVTYNAPPDDPLDNPFYPLGVTRDRYGHVLVSDWNNDCIHLLDKNGHFVRFLLSSGDGVECPSALGIDREHRLWVGNGIGSVNVYQYVI